jgi:hypothetical protein
VLNILEQDLQSEREIRKRTLLFTEVKARLIAAAADLSTAFGRATAVVSPAWASPER